MYEYRRLSPEDRAERVRQRRAQGAPAHSPPHFVTDRQLYLVSAACYEHAPHLLAPDRRRRMQDALFEWSTAGGLDLRAWAILPNHYHLVVSLTDFETLADTLRRLHGATAREWNQADRQPGRKVWYRYVDRAIRSEAHFYTTLNYVHYNPVKHGWARSPYDWAESSVHRYLEQFGREWLRDLWTRYPVRDYGRGWDDI